MSLPRRYRKKPVEVEAMRRHIAQHAPGRAPNITVEYGLIADCSVCPDSGNISTDNTSIWCEVCGSTWDMDGTGGERVE